METINNIKSSHLKKNPFLVPSGYFEALPGEVSQRIEDRVPWSYKMIRSQLALAASFLLIIGLGYGLINLITPKSAETDPFAAGAYMSRLDTYILFYSDEDDARETVDAEQIITFLAEHGISPYSITSLD